MKGQHSSSPNTREQGYELAYELARRQLANMDLEQQCLRSGTHYVPPDRALLVFLNRPYSVSLPDVEVSFQGSDGQVPLKDRIVILHYLVSAKGTPPTNRFATFRDLPGCASYFPVFNQLVIKPILDGFAKEPELLVDAAASVGGRRASYGDASVTVNAFSRIPVTIVMRRGDEEFPPSCTVMFDANVSDYLPTEDIRDVSAAITKKLVQTIPLSSRRER
jgi:hypothetical protein